MTSAPTPLDSAHTSAPTSLAQEKSEGEVGSEDARIEAAAKHEPIGNTHNEQGVDESKYPRGIKLYLISLALCLAVFLVALDQTIIATAIPRITDDFHSLPDVGWYGSSYDLPVVHGFNFPC